MKAQEIREELESLKRWFGEYLDTVGAPECLVKVERLLAVHPAKAPADIGGDRAYLLLTLQHVEARWRQNPDDSTLRGQRDALIVAVRRASEPPEREPGALYQKAGPEAVALRKRFGDIDKARCALGVEFTDRPEIGNDLELYPLACEADEALARLGSAISAKLRKLCGVES